VSKHQSILLPHEGLEEHGFTKDSDSLPLHCFKKLGSKFFKNFFLLSATLHLTNIPSLLSEEFLKNLSIIKGMTKGLKFF
jgi:polypyrimidine tract-binding protein 1